MQALQLQTLVSSILKSTQLKRLKWRPVVQQGGAAAKLPSAQGFQAVTQDFTIQLMPDNGNIELTLTAPDDRGILIYEVLSPHSLEFAQLSIILKHGADTHEAVPNFTCITDTIMNAR
jgi:hypothetical protein